jgi:hypothetical protein
VKLKSLAVVAGRIRPSPWWGVGLFAGSGSGVDTNDWCVGGGTCAVGSGSWHVAYWG